MFVIKILFPVLVAAIIVLLYFNVQVSGTEDFNEKFEGKQVTSFHVDFEEDTIEVGMIGDILLHLPLYNYASFLPTFEPVRKELETLDLLLANQESLPTGKEFGLSGYPSFSSPPHIIGDLQKVGVDLLSIANNHTLDQKEAGILSAIQQLKKYDMPYIGAYESFEDQKSDRVFHLKDVSIGFLSYTYGTNGHATPSGKEYLVSRIDPVKITNDIRDLKTKVDIVIVSMHWGVEYETEPNSEQKELAQMMANAGVDIIFGHHSHVVQPYEVISTATGHQTHVFYSLGNFLSAQTMENTNVGGIAKITITKKTINGKQIYMVENPTFVPTVVMKGDPFTIDLLKDVEDQVGVTDDWVQRHVFGE
ncbi:CapA family protein [Psychrobacillus sp.]|uniref:CapA family protein n=1 Tax=Psychrobacillus sp. TaxID=1871623 RepID=UPI0028BD54CF|nr:CapA family protein [Psychrobacillus sp.]